MSGKALRFVGGGASLVLATLLVANHGGADAPRTLDRHTLWQVQAGDAFLCCAAMPQCEADSDCSDSDGLPQFCDLEVDDELQPGNTDSCTQSPNEEDECTNSVERHVCLKSQKCKAVLDAGVMICVNDPAQPWVDEQNVPDECNGPACT